MSSSSSDDVLKKKFDDILHEVFNDDEDKFLKVFNDVKDILKCTCTMICKLNITHDIIHIL